MMNRALELLLMTEVARGELPRAVTPKLLAAGMRSPKQMLATLTKWVDKSWYDFGVALDLGWLTPSGEVALEVERSRMSQKGHDGKQVVERR